MNQAPAGSKAGGVGGGGTAPLLGRGVVGCRPVLALGTPSCQPHAGSMPYLPSSCGVEGLFCDVLGHVTRGDSYLSLWRDGIGSRAGLELVDSEAPAGSTACRDTATMLGASRYKRSRAGEANAVLPHVGWRPVLAIGTRACLPHA